MCVLYTESECTLVYWICFRFVVLLRKFRVNWSISVKLFMISLCGVNYIDSGCTVAPFPFWQLFKVGVRTRLFERTLNYPFFKSQIRIRNPGFRCVANQLSSLQIAGPILFSGAGAGYFFFKYQILVFVKCRSRFFFKIRKLFFSSVRSGPGFFLK